MRAARHRRVTIADRARAKNSRKRHEITAQDREDLAELEDQCGVQNILSRRAKMDVTRCFLARYSTHFLNDGRDRIANPARTIGYVIKPQIFRAGSTRN